MKYFIVIIATMFSLNTQAKKVKFAVDMTGQTISPNGVHVAGDFQTVAGFAGGDFNAATTLLSQEIADTNIYSVVVDIPAKVKYEYRYVNGDQFYESEFVPEKSRVGYEFNDNRWIYVDSTANDTTFIGALLFGGNAPAGKIMIRTLVDVQNLSVIDNFSGIRISGNFTPLASAYSRLYSFVTGIYEAIYYVNVGTQNFKFYNGIIPEIVPTACTSNGLRSATLNTDSVLAVVCYASCNACITSNLAAHKSASTINIFPNPSSDFSIISFNDEARQHSIYVYDNNGKAVEIFELFNEKTLQINCSNFAKGMYDVVVRGTNNSISYSKLIIK